MKITLTRPKSVDVVKELDRMGVSKTDRSKPPSITMFPQVVDLDYHDVWEKFLSTQTSNDLYTQGDFPEHGLYLVCCGFISYMDNQASSAYDKSKFNLLDNSRRQLHHKLLGFKQDLGTFLRQKNLNRTLSIYKDDISILNPDTNAFINANIDIQAQVTLFMVPRKKFILKKTDFGSTSERTSLDPILYSLKNYLYRNELPSQMQGKKRNLNSNLSKTRYLTESEVLKKPNRQWARVDTKGIHVLAYRAGRDLLALRFILDIPIIFFGGNLGQKDVLVEIKKVIKRSLPM